MPKVNAYSTKYSQAVTHPSTNLAQCCLTSVIFFILYIFTETYNGYKLTNWLIH